MKNGYVMLTARVPAQLVEKLDVFAKSTRRSRTGELTYRLERSLASDTLNEHGVIVSTGRHLNSDQQTGGHQ